jgi:hypothetical protein
MLPSDALLRQPAAIWPRLRRWLHAVIGLVAVECGLGLLAALLFILGGTAESIALRALGGAVGVGLTVLTFGNIGLAVLLLLRALLRLVLARWPASLATLLLGVAAGWLLGLLIAAPGTPQPPPLLTTAILPGIPLLLAMTWFTRPKPPSPPTAGA